MSRKVEKFREPREFYLSFGNTGQNMFGILLCEMAKIKGVNKKISDKADAIGVEPKLLPIPKTYNINNDELMDILNCGYRNLTKTLKPAAITLLKPIVVQDEPNEFELICIFDKAFYKEKSGLTMILTESGFKLIDKMITADYAEIDFRLFSSFESKYTKRLLKILHTYKFHQVCQKKISLDEYKRHMFVDQEDANGSIRKTFSREDSFRKKAIQDPFIELIKHSIGSNTPWVATDKKGVGYELIKQGRYYTHIQFHMRLGFDHNQIKSDEKTNCSIDIEQSSNAEYQAILGLSDVAEPISLTDKEKLIAKIQLYKMMIKDRPQLMTLDRVLEVFALSEKYNFKLDDDELNTLYKLFAELNA